MENATTREARKVTWKLEEIRNLEPPFRTRCGGAVTLGDTLYYFGGHNSINIITKLKSLGASIEIARWRTEGLSAFFLTERAIFVDIEARTF